MFISLFIGEKQAPSNWLCARSQLLPSTLKLAVVKLWQPLAIGSCAFHANLKSLTKFEGRILHGKW